MKKLLSSLLAALMLCGTVITSAMAADTAAVNTIQLKGFYDVPKLTISYSAIPPQLTAESSGQPIHIRFGDSPYVTFSYYNHDDSLRYKEVVTGNQNCDKLAELINNNGVTSGDYIKIEHAEPYSRLTISGAVDNVDFDLSNGVQSLDVANGYLYLGVPKLEFATTLKSEVVAELRTALDAAKQLKKEDYRFDTWQVLQNTILRGEGVVTRSFATNSEIKTATNNLLAAQAGLKENYWFRFLGLNSWEVMNITIDYETMKLRVDGTAAYAHSGFYDNEYFNVTIKDINGNELFSQGCRGAEAPKTLATALNGFKISEGDSIYIKHRESYDRMRVYGPVVDAPSDLSTGMKTATYDTNIHFQLVGGDLHYMT